SRQDPANALPVTPYLSGLRYPLIIEDIRKETYFAYDSNRKTILEPHVLLENGEDETARARSMILSYAIPENVFKMFSHQVQHEVLGAEIMSLRGGGSSREDVYWKDYNVARKYLIALEKSLNDVLKASNPPSNSSFFEIDMNITLKQLYHDLLGNQHNYLILRNRELYNFFNGLKGTLCKWNEIRNLTVHLGDLLIDHESLLNVRRVLLGVGTQSVLVAMHQAAYPELRDLYNIEVPLPNKKTA